MTLCICHGLRQCLCHVNDDNIYLVLERSLIKSLLAKWFKTSHIFHFIRWLKFDYSFVLGNTILTSTKSTVDRTEEQSFTSTKSNLHEEINQNMIEINGRGKTNRRLFADNFLSTVLITFVGTAVSCFLLFSIGSQIKSRLLIKRRQNSHHTPELHVCTHRI